MGKNESSHMGEAMGKNMSYHMGEQWERRRVII